MTSRSYLLAVLLGGALLLGSFAACNYVRDDFGLFGSDGEKRIWTREKTSKYLLAHRYVPENFEGLLIGPSYSDLNFDTRTIEGYRIYNLSIEGGNATELLAIARPALESGRIRFIVISVSAYLTKNSGIKGDQISAKEYWGSLISWLPVEVMQARYAIGHGKIPDFFVGSAWGTPMLDQKPTYPWDEYIERDLRAPVTTAIDPDAFEDLRTLLETARAHNVQVFAYFHPYSWWRWQKIVRTGSWQRYQEQMRSLFDARADVLIDLTSPLYDALRTDVSCYSDSHLSAAGARVVLKEIQLMLDVHYERAQAEAREPIDPHPCLGQPGAGSGFDRKPSDFTGTAVSSMTQAVRFRSSRRIG